MSADWSILQVIEQALRDRHLLRINRTASRWNIRLKQIAAGHEPCFGTEARYGCREPGCPFRRDCMALRAEWLR